MTPDMIDSIIVFLLYLGTSSLMAALVIGGVVAWIWSNGEYADNRSVKGMFKSVLKAWENNAK